MRYGDRGDRGNRGDTDTGDTGLVSLRPSQKWVTSVTAKTFKKVLKTETIAHSHSYQSQS